MKKGVSYVVLIFQIVCTFVALRPLGIIQSYDLLSNHLTVIAYMAAVILMGVLWYYGGDNGFVSAVLLLEFSLLFTSFWYFAEPNGGLLGGYGFPDRALYLVSSSHLSSPAQDNYLASLPGLFLVWATATEVLRTDIANAALLVNVIVGALYSFLVYLVSLRFLRSRDISFLSALIATVGNQFLFRGIELDSLYGVVYFLFLLLLIFGGKKRGSGLLVTSTLFTLVAIITYPIPGVLITGVLLLLILTSILIRNRFVSTAPHASTLFSQLLVTGILWAGWFVYIGTSYGNYLLQFFGSYSAPASTSLQIPYLYSLLQGDILSLPIWSTILVLFWYSVIYLGGFACIVYLVVRRCSHGLPLLLILLPTLLLILLLGFSGGAQLARGLIYIPAITSVALAIFVSKITKRISLVVILILLVTLPTMVSYNSNIGYRIQYGQQLAAGSYLQTKFNVGGTIIYGNGASPLDIRYVWQTWVDRFYQVSGYAAAETVIHQFSNTHQSIFPYSILFADELNHLSGGNSTISGLDSVFRNYIATKDMVYSNGLSMISWNP